MSFQFKVGESFVPASVSAQGLGPLANANTTTTTSTTTTSTSSDTDRDSTDKPKIIMLHILNIPPNTRWRQIKNDLLVPTGISDDSVLHIQVFEENGCCIVSLNSDESAETLLSSLEGYNWNGYYLMARTDEQMRASFNPVELNLNLTPLISQPYLHAAPDLAGQQQLPQIDPRSPPLQQVLVQYAPQSGPPLPPGAGLRFAHANPYGYIHQSPTPPSTGSNHSLNSSNNAGIHPQIHQVPAGYYPGPPIPFNYENQVQQRYIIPSNHSTSAPNSPIMGYRTPYIYNVPLQSPAYYQSPPPTITQPHRYHHQRSYSSVTSPLSPIRKISEDSPTISSRALGSLRQYPYQNITDFDSSIPDKTRLFIGNIPYTSEWKNLKDYLRNAGSINRVEIPNDIDGCSKGFAIATYNNEFDAKRAIEMFNGVEFEGRALTVRFDRFPLKRLGTGNFANYNQQQQQQQPNLDQILEREREEDLDLQSMKIQDRNERAFYGSENYESDVEQRPVQDNEDEDKRYEDEARDLIESIKALNFNLD